MAENSNIAWTDHTFNPWWGCQRVGPGCDNGYAATLDKRTGGEHWDANTLPRRTKEANWRKPLKWNKEAEVKGVRTKVFCASMADVFDNRIPVEWRNALWDLIKATPHLDWQLLTKRVGNDILRGVVKAQVIVLLGMNMINSANATDGHIVMTGKAEGCHISVLHISPNMLDIAGSMRQINPITGKATGKCSFDKGIQIDVFQKEGNTTDWFVSTGERIKIDEDANGNLTQWKVISKNLPSDEASVITKAIKTQNFDNASFMKLIRQYLKNAGWD